MLPVQGAQVQSLVRELGPQAPINDLTLRPGAAK